MQVLSANTHVHMNYNLESAVWKHLTILPTTLHCCVTLSLYILINMDMWVEVLYLMKISVVFSRIVYISFELLHHWSVFP